MRSRRSFVVFCALFSLCIVIMAEDVGYRIVESGSRGKIMVATKEFLPGDSILEESPTIFLEAATNIQTCDKSGNYDGMSLVGLVPRLYEVMTQLSPEKRAKIFGLYGPTTDKNANSFRDVLLSSGIFRPSDNSPPRKLTEKEREILVKIFSVMRLNMFGVPGGYGLYTEITRIAHSCAANCMYEFHGKNILCRVLKQIAVGEELTLSYNAERDAQTTHIRRQKYLQMKDFTCHCPRCDALGDDTRQFNCCDPACKGVMMACQPINQEKLVNDPSYTGVEYVEPHLLPCTVCHRTAPATYQTEMFTLEATLPDRATRLTERLLDIIRKGPKVVQHTLNEEVNSLPLRHTACWPLLLARAKLVFALFVAKQTTKEAVASAALEFLAVQKSVFPHPHSIRYQGLAEVCQLFASECPWGSVFAAEEEKQLLQDCVRMRLLLYGRESRAVAADRMLAAVLEKLPATERIMEVCAFCEESPLRAALTLSRCGRCRQVCYCSAGCQKAHWKLHKKTCQPTGEK